MYASCECVNETLSFRSRLVVTTAEKPVECCIHTVASLLGLPGTSHGSHHCDFRPVSSCWRCRCAEGEHNDLATLFLSSSHHTIVKLFSMGHDPGEPYVTHFTQGSLALFVVVYLILMSVGAGVAIPGGLFMPSLIVGVISFLY